MPSSDYTPSVDAVGALLRSRTIDTNGNELGTFSANTRPTDSQVTALVETAIGELAAAVGEDLPAELQGLARTAATYRAASLIEISYFPEQVLANRSPYEQLHTLWLETLASLRGTSSSGGGGGLVGPAEPSYSFPCEVLPLNGVLGIAPYPGGAYR